MCGRFTLKKNGAEVADHFGLADAPVLTARYNIAPTQPVLVVRAGANTPRREAVHLRWGLTPAWAKAGQFRAPLINARAETLAAKPAFRQAFKERRCLIPADGFYEWAAVSRGLAGKWIPDASAGRQPWRMERLNQELFALAGLWEYGPRAEGGSEQPGESECCTMITTAAASWMAPFHDRMPVVMPPERYADWLDPQAGTVKEWAEMLQHTPVEGWQMISVAGKLPGDAAGR